MIGFIISPEASSSFSEVPLVLKFHSLETAVAPHLRVNKPCLSVAMHDFCHSLIILVVHFQIFVVIALKL